MKLVNFLISTYKQSVKNVPILRYSWVLITTICVLALAGYLKLKNSDVFYYALGVIVISFIAFTFSLLLKVADPFIKILMYMLLTCIIAVFCAAVLGFGSFIFTERPGFYKRWFPDKTQPAPILPDSLKHSIPPPKKPKTFSLNFNDKILTDSIKAKTGMNLTQTNADYAIVLTYDGNKLIRNRSAGTFGLMPSFPQVLINGQLVCKITEFPINGLENITDQELVLSTLKESVANMPPRLINMHIKQILEWLKK